MARYVRPAILFLAALGFLAPCVWAQQPASPTGVPTRVIVTVEAKHGSNVPAVNREDVMVHQGHERDKVADWVPLQGDHAALELFILLDDGLNATVGSQFDDIREFITSLPASTAVGIGYMRNGSVDMVQNITTDHARAAKALRLPLGDQGIATSPYVCLSDLIAGWKPQEVRREILMISDGVDPLYGGGAVNPYVDQAIAAAQKADVIIYSIYAQGAGHAGHSYWLLNWGQNYESQVADETGGEFYYLGFWNGPSFTPYLDDLAKKLNHQYLLTFLAKPEKKPALVPLKVQTEVPNAEVVAARKAWVPVGQ